MDRQTFRNFTDKLARFGYRVYLGNIPESNYAVFTDGVNIGKIREADFGVPGITVSTCHKPCRNYGTGIRCQKAGEYLTYEEFTKEKAQEAFHLFPVSYRHADYGAINKYRDFEEWKQSGYAEYYDIS